MTSTQNTKGGAVVVVVGEGGGKENKERKEQSILFVSYYPLTIFSRSSAVGGE